MNSPKALRSEITFVLRSGLVGIVFGALLVTTQWAAAQTFETLYSFGGAPDGAFPVAPVVLDANGNFYGTTPEGGTSSSCPGGCGTVFSVTPAGAGSVVYSFKGNSGDGANPRGGLVDLGGTLYGTTMSGGSHGYNRKYQGFGTVFVMSLSGSESVIRSFTGGVNAFPQGVIKSSQGFLAGTTEGVGTKAGERRNYGGTVFTLNRGDKALYKFNNPDGSDGLDPQGGLAQDAQGNFYGTTYLGGVNGSGIIFEVTPSGVESVLHSFGGVGDGSLPNGNLIRDGKGNLYGTTGLGGAYGSGTAFEVSASGTETLLHSFGSGTDGKFPGAGLVMDSQGNLFGTTYSGGTFGYGTVFELTAGNEVVLYNFTGGTDGANPEANLILDAQGNLYGTTREGGIVNSQCSTGCGTVFELTP